MKRALSRKNIWEALPTFMWATVGRGLGSLPAEWLLGREFRKTLAFVREAQWWPAERVRQFQLEKLRGVCSLAYSRTDYYRRVYDSVGFKPEDLRRPEDLAAVPTIDKETLRDHLPAMCTLDSGAPTIDFVSTGGSGGVPLHFYIGSGRSSIEYAYLVASWMRAGYQMAIPQAVLQGRTVPKNRQGLRHKYDPILRRHYYSNFHTTEADLRRYLDHISGIGPCFLLVYPSSVAALARVVDSLGLEAPDNVQGILAGSEIVYPENRSEAEQAFGTRYFSWYGHTEKLVMAAECEHSDDYHVWPTYGYFELLDDDGQPVTTPGQRGEIVGTGFINTVVPFVRYRTGDYATYVGDHCNACHREHFMIREVKGHRTQEVLVAADGTEISWTAMNMHDDTFEHVRQFQFYQDVPGRATLRLVPLSGFGEEDKRRVIQNLGRKLGDRLRLTIEIRDALPVTHSGKVIYVDQCIDGRHLRDPEALEKRHDMLAVKAESRFDQDQASGAKDQDLPHPPDLPHTRVVTPVSVLSITDARPAPQIVYPNPVRKAIRFLAQEGLGWTLAKVRSKLFYRRIASHAALVVVVGKIDGTEQWCIACGSQFSPDLPQMLFREELVFAAVDRDAAVKTSKAIADGLCRDGEAAQRLANFSHYSTEQAPPVPGAERRSSVACPEQKSKPSPPRTRRVRRGQKPSQERRRLILVGAGDYAYTFVLPHLHRHDFDTVVDYNPLTARAVAKHFQFENMETDYRRVVEHAASLPEVTIIVAGYHSQHTETAIAFLEANPKACLMIEKPPVVGYRQLARLLPYFKDESVFVEAGFNRRYTAMVSRAAKELSGRSQPIIMNCVIREDDMEPSHWYFWKSEGTRVYGNLCHWIDLGVHLIGSSPVEIVGLSGEDFQAAASVSIRFEDDSLLNLVSGTMGSGLRGVQEFVDVRSGTTTIQIHDFRRMIIQRGAHEKVLRSRTRDKGHREMYRCLANNLEGPRRPRYSARDLIHTCVLTEEIRQMMVNGERRRTVDVAPWLTGEYARMAEVSPLAPSSLA